MIPIVAPIALITNLDQQEQQHWWQHLQQQMPDERIVLAEDIGPEEVAQVKIAIIANPAPEQVARFPQLIWVHSLWAGVDKLINQASLKRLKLVRLIDPQMSQTMAEAVLAWTLYLHRLMPQYADQQRARQWRQLPCPTAAQTRVSVLGAGALGLAAIETLASLHYQVNCWSNSPKHIDGINCFHGSQGLIELLQQTDILVVLLPLTPTTRYLLDKQRLSALPQGAKIINFARGAIIDTPALVAKLQQRHIAHAVLDVFEQEPLAADDPLWSNPNITLLPHISAPTNFDSAAKVVADNIARYRTTGKIPDPVDMTKGY